MKIIPITTRDAIIVNSDGSAETLRYCGGCGMPFAASREMCNYCINPEWLVSHRFVYGAARPRRNNAKS